MAVAKWFVVFWKRFGADHEMTWVGYVVNVIRFFQKHIMWPSIKEQFSHFSPQKKNHILHENFEAHHLIQHGQYLRILLERWTKKFTYLLLHIIILSNKTFAVTALWTSNFKVKLFHGSTVRAERILSRWVTNFFFGNFRWVTWKFFPKYY